MIGLVDCVVLNRTEGPVSDHKTRAADEKESRRWLHGAEIAGDRLTAAAAITMVSDVRATSTICSRGGRRMWICCAARRIRVP